MKYLAAAVKTWEIKYAKQVTIQMPNEPMIIQTKIQYKWLFKSKIS